MATPNQQDEAMRFESSRAGSGQWAVGRAKEVSLAPSLQPLASPRSGMTPRCAMTLVELLVVIVLVTTLVTTVIPILSPGGDNKRLREASRNLNAYLQGAQARAIETGRPFGVAFQRLSADTDRGADNAVCIRAEYVEVPPHYSGFSPTSAVRLSPAWVPSEDDPARRLFYDPNSPVAWRRVGPVWIQFVARGGASAGMPAGWAADQTPPQFLRPGDTVEVQGHRYVLLDRHPANTNNSDPTLRAVDGFFPGTTSGSVTTLLAKPEGMPDGAAIERMPTLAIKYDANGNPVSASSPYDRPFWTEASPYKILRQPVPAGGEPLEMPGSVALDLQASAFTNGARLFQPTQAAYNASTGEFAPISSPVMVLFSPQGNIDRVIFGTDSAGLLTSSSVTSTLALCLGRRELIPPKQTERAANLTTASVNGPPLRYDEPINLNLDIAQAGISETEAKAVMDQYNWLNLDSRWVLIGGQSGAVSTIATSGVYPSIDTASVDQQIAAAIANASTRTTAGGR